MRRRNARSPLGSSIAGERRTKKLEPPRDSATLSFPGPFECRSPRELAEGGPGESRWVLIGPAPQVPPPRRWGRARRRGDAHGILLCSFYCGNSEMATGFSAAAPSRDPGSISQVLGSRGKKKKKKNHPAPQSPQHSKKNVFEPCGGKWDKCGDASEPDWKRGVPFILPQGTLLYKALMEAGCVLPTPGYSGGCPLPPSPPPMPAGSEDTGVRFKTGSEVQRGRVTHYAATCGKLLSSIAQPNKWRLGEKAPVWRLSWRQRGRGRWAVIRDPPPPPLNTNDTFSTLCKM